MDHEADVGLVDPHAESHGRDDYRDVVVDEPILNRRPIVVQPGVVRHGLESVRRQHRRQVLGAPTARPIDNRGTVLVLPQITGEAAVLVGLRVHGVREVGSVEAGDEHVRVAEAELAEDILPNPLGGRGRKRDDRNIRERCPERAQVPVVGPELMAPL